MLKKNGYEGSCYQFILNLFIQWLQWSQPKIGWTISRKIDWVWNGLFTFHLILQWNNMFPSVKNHLMYGSSHQVSCFICTIIAHREAWVSLHLWFVIDNHAKQTFSLATLSGQQTAIGNWPIKCHYWLHD